MQIFIANLPVIQFVFAEKDTKTKKLNCNKIVCFEEKSLNLKLSHFINQHCKMTVCNFSHFLNRTWTIKENRKKFHVKNEDKYLNFECVRIFCDWHLEVFRRYYPPHMNR